MTDIAPLERRQLTVMLCDMVGWSGLSTRLDAEELAEVVLRYRERCGEVIARHGGMVAQYVGDGILAYFGYPRAHEDDAERAVRAALEIAGVERTSAETPRSDVHIGIATGSVVVGVLGGNHGETAQSREVSAVGTAPNLASRLQQLAGPGKVVVSDETRRLCGAIFEYHDLGRHAVKGFEDPVHAWEVTGEHAVQSRFHALRASSLTPLVGRRAEAEQLAALWEQAGRGDGSAVLITGEAGVGKSRLAAVVASQIAAGASVRIWFYCAPNRQSSPLAPILRQVVAGTGIQSSDDAATKLAKLARVVPVPVRSPNETVALLAHLLSIPYESLSPPLDMSPQRLRQRLFEALMQVIEAHAARGPVLMIVEDLHWIDPSSHEFVALLVQRVHALRMLVVLTARPEFESHFEAECGLVHMPLAPLDRSESAAMVNALRGDAPMATAIVDQIAEKSDGVPLFIEDLTRDVLERNSSDRPPSGDGHASALTVPATLNDSLMSRLDRLGPAKSVAQAAAVIGREFSYEVLARTLSTPDEELKDSLQRLMSARLIDRRRSTPTLAYAFKHALVRDLAYSSLLRTARQSMHAKVAQVLSKEFPEVGETQPEILAQHLELGGDMRRAAEYLALAAKLSARRSGFIEAIAQLRHVIELLGRCDRDGASMHVELRAYLALGGIYAEYKGFSSDECGVAYRRALEICRTLGDAPEIFAVLSGLGSFEITRANFDACRALGEECLVLAAKQDQRPPFVMGHLLLGGTAFLTAQFASALEHLDAAVAEYEQDRRVSRRRQVLYVQDQKSTALCYRGLALCITGDTSGAIDAAESGLEHSRALGGQHTINFSLCYLAATLHIAGDDERALRRADEALALAREQGFATWIGISQVIRGNALVRLNKSQDGLAEIRAGIKAHDDINAVTYRPFALALLADAALRAGEIAPAGEALREALGLAEKTGEQFYLPELWRLHGEMLIRTNDPMAAEQSFRKSIDTARAQGAKLFEARSTTSLSAIASGTVAP